MTSTSRAPQLVVAVWQPDGPLLDVPAAIQELDDGASRASAQGARLLVAPELTLTGYDIAPQAADLAEPAGGPMAQAVAATAERHGLAIAWSWPERDGGQVHISAELVDRDGTVLARHRKAHLYGPDEAGAYAPGTGTPQVGTIDGYDVGLLVCYDIEFPEQVRMVALAGADLLACPTALMAPYDAVSTLVVPARAFENQMAVAYANRAGVEHELTYTGLSCVVGPDGVDLARAGRDADLVVGTLTAASLDDARRANTHLADRRPEIYGGLTR